MKMKPRYLVGTLCALALAVTTVVFAANPPASVNLAWDQSPASNVDYLLYVGNQTGVYTSSNNVGPALATTLGNLTRGQAYFFAVTAKFNTNAPPDAIGLESDPSNEISYTPPAAPGAPPNLRIP